MPFFVIYSDGGTQQWDISDRTLAPARTLAPNRTLAPPDISSPKRELMS